VIVPDWWSFVILALAVFRIYRLIAEDDILDRPRRYVTRLGDKWEKEGDPTPPGYRERLGNFVTCPYCLGFWIALAFWGAWQIEPHGTLVFAAPWVISAGVVAAHRFLSE
jgi:hypothetical protein